MSDKPKRKMAMYIAAACIIAAAGIAAYLITATGPKVSFNSQGGSVVKTQAVKLGGKAARPADPERPGHAFGGWYLDAAYDNIWNFDTDIVSSNITLYAKWAKSEPSAQEPEKPAPEPEPAPEPPAPVADAAPPPAAIEPCLAGMAYVKGGSFAMGCTDEQGGDCLEWEKPARNVTVSSFYVCKTPVTQKEWRDIMGTTIEDQMKKANKTKLNGVGDNHPMYYVSWDDANKYVDSLRKKTGKRYRLLTEAEWEYAARGGQKSKGLKYAGSDNIDNAGWHNGNAGGNTHNVCQKAKNELGLCDMSGNVWEWTSDWYDKNYYKSEINSNPKGPNSGNDRVNRGGSWSSNAAGCRTSFRGADFPGLRYSYLGFRVAMSP
jgi:uncharacterized repeat protein (TIGR02543 family)